MQIVCVNVSDQIFNPIMPILCLDVRKLTHIFQKMNVHVLCRIKIC